MKRCSQYLRARGRAGRGHRPGAGRRARGHCKRRRGGPGSASAAAIRQAGGASGPAIRPKAGRARRRSGRRGKAAGGAGCCRGAVCRRCSRARRSAVCWHRAGGRRWHGMQQAGRRRNARCSRCAAGGAAVLCWCEVWPVWAAVWGCCPLLYSYVGRGRGAAVVLIGAARGEDRRRGSSARRRVQTAAAAGGCDLHTGGGAGV